MDEWEDDWNTFAHGRCTCEVENMAGEYTLTHQEHLQNPSVIAWNAWVDHVLYVGAVREGCCA